MHPDTFHWDESQAFSARLIKSFQKELQDIEDVQRCQLRKVTIVINGSYQRTEVNKIFSYPTGAFLESFKEFLQSYADQVRKQIAALQPAPRMLRLGNQIVSLDDFIKDFTAGEIPSIDQDTVNSISLMYVGATLTVIINNVSHQVTRIS